MTAAVRPRIHFCSPFWANLQGYEVIPPPRKSELAAIHDYTKHPVSQSFKRPKTRQSVIEVMSEHDCLMTTLIVIVESLISQRQMAEQVTVGCYTARILHVQESLKFVIRALNV